LSNLNVKPPLHKREAPPHERKAPLLTTFWRQFWLKYKTQRRWFWFGRTAHFINGVMFLVFLKEKVLRLCCSYKKSKLFT